MLQTAMQCYDAYVQLWKKKKKSLIKKKSSYSLQNDWFNF